MNMEMFLQRQKKMKKLNKYFIEDTLSKMINVLYGPFYFQKKSICKSSSLSVKQ